MTHFNLNRMLQGCSAFIQTMAGDRAARNDAKRVNNHVLPFTCPLLASSLRLTCPLQLRRIALIFAVLVMSVANIGTAWAWYLPGTIHYEAWGKTDNNMGADNKIVFYGVPAGTYRLQLTDGNDWSGSGCIRDLEGTGISKGTSGSDATITLSAAKDLTITVVDEGNWKIKVAASAPSYHIKYNWNNSTWLWSHAMTDNGDGTYSCIGQYSGAKTVNVIKYSDNHDDTSGAATKTATIIGANPSKGDKCVFTLKISDRSVTIRKCNTVNSGSGTHYVWFDNTESNWSDTYKYFVIGRPCNDGDQYSKVYSLSRVSNSDKSNLWYFSTTDVWDDAAYYGVVGSGASWSGTNWSWANLSNASHYSAPFLDAYNMVKSKYSIASKTDAANGGALTFVQKDGHSSLNAYSQTINYALSIDGGSTYTTIASGGPKTPGQISISEWYQYNSATNVGSAKSAQTLSANGTTYTKTASSAGYRTKVVLDESSTQTGYQFVGWYEGDVEKATTASYTYYPNAVTTMTARFRTNIYTVVFNKNDDSATGTMANQTHYYGAEKALTSNGFSHPSKVFTGWATSSSGAVVYTDGQSVTNLSSTEGATVNLFAKWGYALTYDKNTSDAVTNMPSSGAAMPGSTTLDSKIPVRSGYVFVGWQVGGAGTIYQPGGSYTMPSSAVTMKAKWVAENMKITDACKGDSWGSDKAAGDEITSANIKGTISGGTVFSTGSTSIGANASNGLVIDGDGDEITITVTGVNFVAGSAIVIGAKGTDSGSSHTCGFVVSSNTPSPATVKSSTSTNDFRQVYIVTAGDGVIGTNSFTIKRKGSSDKIYLKYLYVGGCEEPSCSGPTINSFVPTGKTDGTYEVGTTLGSITVTATAGNGGALSYLWYQYDGGNIGAAVAAAGTNNAATYNIPNNAACVERHYYCVVSEAGCSTTRTSDASGALTLTAATYSVTYNANGGTGSVPTDATAYSSGQRPVVKGPGDLAWDGHTFIGWNDKADGSGTYYSEKANFAISASKILYAQWRTASSCPGSAGGTVFSLSMNNRTESGIQLAKGVSVNLSSHATITNGGASITNISTSDDNKATITKASPALVQFGGAAAMLAIYLDCPLQDGDVITFTGGDKELCFTATTERAESIATSSKSLTISTASHSSLIGKKTIFIWRKGGDTFGISALSITRPEGCSDPVINEATTTSSFDGGSWAAGSGHNITITATGAESYEWYRNTSAADAGATKLSATGNTIDITTEGSPVAGTTYYFKAVAKSGTCSSSTEWSWCGAMTITAAPTASTSVNIEQFVLDNRKSKFTELKAALDAAHISYDLTAGCDLDSLDDACNKTDRNNDYLGLKIKAGAKYIEMNVPSGKTLKVRFGKRAAAVKVWIDEVAQTDISTDGNYYTYELASSASNRVVKIATADGNAVVIKQIMIGEDIKTVTLPAKITCGATTNGTISVASAKVNVGSTVTVTATPASGYELETLTYTPACPDDASPVNIDIATKQFTMPNGNVTINATFTAAAPATYSITYNCDGASSGCPTDVAAATSLPDPLPSAPTKDGYTFGGWYTNSEKTVAAVAGATLTANTTLYAKWTADECTPTTLFSMVVSGSASDYSLAKSTTKTSADSEISGRLTSISGGTFSTENTSTSSSKDIFKNNCLKVSSADVYYSIALSGGNTLQAGDIITITTKTAYAPYITSSTTKASNPTMAMSGSSDPYTYTLTLGNTNSASGKDIIGAGTLYLWKNSSDVYIHSITIQRPCAETCTTPTIAWSTTPVNGAEGGNMNATVTTNYATGVTYTTSNSSIVSVSGNGTTTCAITYGSAGTARVTATVTGDGSDYCTGPVSISIDITVSAAAGDCEELAHTAAASANTLNTTVGTASLSSPSSQSTNDGAIKLGSSGYIELTPKAGKSFAAGDSLIVVIYNQATKAKTTGFNIGDDEYTASIAKQSNNTFRQKLTAANIKSGKVKIERHDSDGWFVSIIIKHCDDCTMPSISAHPSSATYTKGDSPAALSITATNTTSYQWFSNEENANTGGNSISGATSASYTPSAAITGTTYYYCEATNACGTVASNTATITVNSDLPTPKAVWTGTTTSPNYGGGGYAVVVEANKNDDSDWDGTLEASMLTASTGITLRDITVNNTDKKITATYDVTQTATSPITFTLSLPETATQGQADLTYDVAFSTCAGSGGEAAWHYFFTNAADATANSVSNDATVFTEVPSSTGTTGANFSFTIDGKTFASMKYGYKGQTSQGTAMGTLVVPSGYQAISFVAVVNAGGNGLNMKLYQEDTEKASTGNITNGDGNIGTISATLPAGSYTIKPTGRDCARLYAYAVKLQEIEDGNINTALEWSNSQTSGTRVDKNEGDPGFVITANRSGDAANTSLGVISYVSSDVSVATVNATTGRVTIEDDIDFGAAEYKETTITATLAASGCYKRAQITYVLRVTKHECPDVAGTIVSVDNGCSGVTMTISGYTEGATIQWYKDDAVITGETGTSYTATTNGNYYAKTTVAGEGHCTLASTNSIDVTMAATTSTKLIDEWYVKNERRTPDIALVQTNNAAGWSVSPTTLGGCGFYLGDDGIIYLKGTQDDGSAPDGLTNGDQTITVTVNACGGGSTNHTITIHKQAATVIPSIAFVVDGTKGGTIDAVEAAKTTERAIWTYLADYFSLTACNAYWTTEEKKLRQYYSQFDAIVITDDPSTYTKSSSEPKIEYIKAMGGMVDIRPLLTMEAFVGRYGEGGWGVYNASPESPNPRQYTMRLQCKEHTIYKDLVEGTNVVKTTIAGVDYWDVTMVDKTLAPYATAKESEYATKPALQGFDANKFNGMLGIGTIAKGTLQGGVERQKEAAARMMILGIQNQAMDALTPEGKQIVKNAIEYLLLTDMDDIEDCSNYFHGQGGTNTAWSTPANWSSGKVPDATTKARLLAPCEVSGEAVASSIEIVTGGKTTRYKSGASNCEGHLTINASGILNVDGTIRRVASAPNFGDVSNTRPSDLLLESNSSQTGALIHNQTDNAIGATIELQSKAYSEKVTTDGVTKKKKYWQYVGLPVQNALAEEAFWGAYTYLYDETSGWIKKRTGDNLQEFWGIGLSSDVDELGSSPKFSIAGDLALATDRDIELTKTAGKGKGENLIGNSWTAPIHLVNMTDEDFEGAIATVYIFNTGRSETTPTYGAGDLGTAGQWRTIPVGTSRLPEWKGPKVIPAMQAFQVNVDDESSSGTLHLNYEKHVRSIGTSTEENHALMAPQRYKAATPSMLRLRVADSTTYTDLYLIEGDQFSDEFDNGWEGQYMPCDGRSAKLCALNSTNEEMAVLAQQSINNTSVVFAPGRDTEYTFTFGYDGDVTYYLNDIQLEKSTEIREGNEYHFTSNEGDLSIRFVVSTTPYGSPSVTTGTGIAGEAEKAHKVIYNKHVYIIRGGRMYDVVGKTVR